MTQQISKITLGVCLFGLFISVNSQNVNLDIATEKALMSKNISTKIVADGSPYIDENFTPTKITQYAGKIYSARYNAYNDEMEVRIGENKIIALDNTGDFEVIFTINNKTYKTESYVTDTGISKRGFLVVVNTNEKLTLYKEERVKFYEKVQAASSYQQDKPAKYRREGDRFYLKVADKIIAVSQKKKDLINMFPEHSEDLKKFIKKSKLNPKNEADLIKIFDHIATLM